MNLIDALDAIAPAVGDGKLIAQHAYVLSQRNILHATDGRQWAKVDVTGGPLVPFCVRYEALKRAAERDGMTAMVSDGANGLKLSYGRGRATLKGIDPATFPMLPSSEVHETISLPPEFHHRVKDLLAFCSGTDGHIWTQAVHIQPNFLFAANSYALAKCALDWNFQRAVGIPYWAANFIASRAGAPQVMHDRGQMISFGWPGLELYTTLLTEEASENVVTFASNLSGTAIDVPDGLKEATQRLLAHGAKTCKIGQDSISYANQEIELEDSLELPAGVKTWGVETLAAALVHATSIDLNGTMAYWQGNGYIGVFSGRSD